ncbi:hypothetical protein DIS24_g6224 [Lasiodiplodia hormozganensis]|uniref:Uncharacterized protein n=1 Tax=Lasiodiplodia hormozganensis TaxID=869390 RepID=A0AA40CXV8_9PEZI|nr:hypothetical protein DIS24_g6224 [Lasiodiplodia hormozganensis]
MDARQPGPPQRPQLIQNPNHHPTTTSAPSTHPSYSQYQPPQASQPPIHSPFSDPFQRHDPFMPPATQRRGSYGMSSRDSAGGGWRSNNGTPHAHDAQIQHQQTAQQPPQPSSTAASSTRPHQNSAPPPPPPNLSQGPNGSGHVPYTFDSQRRRSLGGGSPPQYYAEASSAPGWITPSIAARRPRTSIPQPAGLRIALFMPPVLLLGRLPGHQQHLLSSNAKGYLHRHSLTSQHRYRQAALTTISHPGASRTVQIPVQAPLLHRQGPTANPAILPPPPKANLGMHTIRLGGPFLDSLRTIDEPLQSIRITDGMRA